MAKFDGLANDYDATRPRYPVRVLQDVLCGLPQPRKIVDAGAGTGIVLEALDFLGIDLSEAIGVDISNDMVEVGRTKFPQVKWVVDEVETVLTECSNLDLILCGQSYQWFKRIEFLNAAKAALRPGGRLVLLQNDRIFPEGYITGPYELLLEELSPGYRRNYRGFPIEDEFHQVFGNSDSVEQTWENQLAAEHFFSFVSSSTQAQRALKANPVTFKARVHELIEEFNVGGTILVPYLAKAVVSEKR